MTEREFAIDVVRRLQGAGHQALWAGGCVRDELLGLVPKDYDVATDARPEEVRKLFRRTVAVGMSFGVVEVIGPRVGSQHLIVQVATFRSDVAYSDGRRPDAVVFSSPQEDALRRDFTVNGMFFDPINEELIDYVGGLDDLHNKILRAIGEPQQRFAEDKLRLLRAVRIAARFELDIEPHTGESIRKMADQIVVVSAERIAEELRKLLEDRNRVRAVNLLYELGLIKPILPELLLLKGFPHETTHLPEDLWYHTTRMLGFLGEEVTFPLAFAILLHEVGRPAVAQEKSDAVPEIGNPEKLAARTAEDIADRLRLSNAEKERIVWLVAHQQALRDAPRMRVSKLKQILVQPGIRDLLALHRVRALANEESTEAVEFCEQKLRQWTEQDLNPPPLLTGNDLKSMGLKPSPWFKEILDAVREEQLEGTVTTTEQAKELAQRLIAGKEGER